MNRRLALSTAAMLIASGISLAAVAQADAARAPSDSRITAAPRAPLAEAADSPAADDLYVSTRTCTAGGDGSLSRPFCTISAAAAVAQPGQTVRVEPGTYVEDIAITRSGTSANPITFLAESSGTRVLVASLGQLPATTPIFSIAHVHDVIIRGFQILAPTTAPGFLIDDSTDITVDQGEVQSGYQPAVRVTGESQSVVVSRVIVYTSRASGIEIDAGASHVDIAANQVDVTSAGGPAVLVTDASDVDITNNTILSTCMVGVDVTGTSSGISIENNIVESGGSSIFVPMRCAQPSQATAIEVSAASTSQSTADYNLIDPTAGGPLYVWGANSYDDLPAFQAATGQAIHDIAAGPGFSHIQGDYVVVGPDSPAIDSADENARGELATDMSANGHADDPDVPNSGTGNAYADRGSFETVGVGSKAASLARVVGGGPLDVIASARLKPIWTMDGPIGAVAYSFSGQPYPTIVQALSLPHTANRAGKFCVQMAESVDGFRTMFGGGPVVECTVLGAYYTPRAPTRILDTRNAIGVITKTPVAPRGTVTLSLVGIVPIPVSSVTAVVMNVTATQTTGSGYLTAYSGDYRPTTSNLNFTPGESVPNLVTVPVVDASIHFYNGSAGTTHVIADFVGYYGAGGFGFKPLTPVRVLDTRSGTGSGAAIPIAGGATLPLDMSAKLPADTTAVVLNVTATRASRSGYLTIFPDGQAPPLASNLNFVAGETVPNLVVVPVVNGRVDIRNGSSGAVDVIADLEGLFGPDATGARQSYVPDGPKRIVDTRTQFGSYFGDSTAHGVMNVVPDQLIEGPNPPPATSTVVTVTVTGPVAGGYLTAYPSKQARPLASNLNFVAHETVANLVVVQTGPDAEFDIYNGSSGTTNIIIDEEGYFIGPP
jgi:hypothetical protein